MGSPSEQTGAKPEQTQEPSANSGEGHKPSDPNQPNQQLLKPIKKSDNPQEDSSGTFKGKIERRN
jgi:hypothetical protein